MYNDELIKQAIGKSILDNLRYLNFKPVFNKTISPLYPTFVDVNNSCVFILTMNGSENNDLRTIEMPHINKILNKDEN